MRKHPALRLHRQDPGSDQISLLQMPASTHTSWSGDCFVSTRGVLLPGFSSCRACDFFKHHCPSPEGIPNSETTQAKVSARAKPVSFKCRASLLALHSLGLLRQHVRRVASLQRRTSGGSRHAEPTNFLNITALPAWASPVVRLHQ